MVAKQHVDVPIPEPKEEEILVKVEVAGVNPLDWRLQEGIARPILPRKFPFVPGLLHLPITITLSSNSKCENICIYIFIFSFL